ncbi:MAG: magnesium transporter [Clostridiales bacterium]|nr:magnesium transporter [Clostridiales bacterium]
MAGRVNALVKLMHSKQTDEQIQIALSDAHERDIAAALEQLDAHQRARLYRLLGVGRVGDVFSFVGDAGKYLRELPQDDAASIVEAMDADDAVDALETVSPELRSALIEKPQHDIQLICSYQPDEIGSAMTTNFISINRHLSVKQAMRALIAQAEENDNITTLFVSDDDGSFYGAIDLKDLIVARDTIELDTLVSRNFPTVSAHAKIEDCLERLRSYSEAYIPVLGEKRRVIGVITTDDIVEAVDHAMGDDYAKLGGLSGEEDLHEPLKTSLKKRMPWLIILLFLGMGVSSVVGLFESVVSQIALIVCFQSLILDMAGNVGTQSLAVTIRVLMDENLKPKQKFELILKEMRIGFSGGILLGLLAFVFIGLYVWLLKGKTLSYALCISGCAGVALLVSMVLSSLVGTAIPMIFKKIHVDPAVASGPLITTVNDLVAVIAYYGLAYILFFQILHIA